MRRLLQELVYACGIITILISRSYGENYLSAENAPLEPCIFTTPAGFVYNLTSLRLRQNDYRSENFIFNVCGGTITTCLDTKTRIAQQFGGTYSAKYKPDIDSNTGVCRKITQRTAKGFLDFFLPYAEPDLLETSVTDDTDLDALVARRKEVYVPLRDEAGGLDVVVEQIFACECDQLAFVQDETLCEPGAEPVQGTVVLQFRCRPEVIEAEIKGHQLSEGCITTILINSPHACPRHRVVPDPVYKEPIVRNPNDTVITPSRLMQDTALDGELVMLLLIALGSLLCVLGALAYYCRIRADEMPVVSERRRRAHRNERELYSSVHHRSQ